MLFAWNWEERMKRQYVKVNEKGIWHLGTRSIWTMCGRSMPYKMSDDGLGVAWHPEPWAAIADEPYGPVCKTCLKALAAWEREFGDG